VFASLKRRSDLLEGALSHRMHGNPRGWAKSLRDMGVGMQPCLWQHLLRVEAPALLVTGTEDPKFRGIAAKMAAELPHAEEAAIGGAGHNTHLERPTEFVSALRRFLDGDSEQ
jgi:2-succinyl-6-hydroxy-2,4-cyclohexadiene-1-carboxylate synthase